MKVISIALFLICALQGLAWDIDSARARRFGALMQENLCVVDQDGIPVQGARVWCGVQTGPGMNDYSVVSGSTDTNGEYCIQAKCTKAVNCRIRKHGYYACETNFVYGAKGSSEELSDGRWQPYGERRVIRLMKMINPVPMTGWTRRRDFKIPRYGDWIGFDLEAGDYTKPHGAGKCDDVLLRFFMEDKAMDDCRMTMEVSFTNSLCAGAYKFSRRLESELQGEYKAATNATYESYLKYVFERRPGCPVLKQMLSESEGLVFRIRTVVDEAGNLKSARYGKMLGPWKFVGPGGMSLPSVQISRADNDLNLEDEASYEAALKSEERFNASHPEK